MSQKLMNGIVIFMAVLLASVPAWSSIPRQLSPGDSGKTITPDMTAVTDDIFKADIILARGGGGGGGGLLGHDENMPLQHTIGEKNSSIRLMTDTIGSGHTNKY
ncbi:hypothetical protein [Desulfobacula sp.]|uniref:hypothetical protein n=1 Tax=Desulfobacula sp. TaxID=2593537 RepID=UPI002639AA04|nr:hypothetical protein [Desulfobacula sp.]